jgi:DeoR/GlpR family transcriptional regulator of sugar metabolism
MGRSLTYAQADYEYFRFSSIRKLLTCANGRRIVARIAEALDLRKLSQSERQQHVLRLLETRDYVPVTELAEAFAVSEVTVRSDLGELARQGLVARIRGGVRALQQGQSEVGFDLRLRLEVERKRAIARAAAAMVDEGEAVALDASTTA